MTQSAGRLPSLLGAALSVTGEMSLPPLLRGLAAAVREETQARAVAIVIHGDAATPGGVYTSGPPGTATALTVRPVDDNLRREPVQIHGADFGTIVVELDGTVPAGLDHLLADLAHLSAAAIDTARRFERLRRRERSLAALHEISSAMAAGLDPDVVLERVTSHARELVSADTATIALPTSQAGMLALHVTSGYRAGDLRDMTFPVEGSITADVLATGQPVILDDASADRRTSQPVVRIGGFGPTMFLPLLSSGKPLGTLVVANRRGGPRFTRDDLSLIETYATHAGIAFDYGRARRELSEMAVIAERERLARELHGVIAERLFGVGLDLESVAMRVAPSHPDLEHRLRAAVDDLDRTIQRIRSAITAGGPREAATEA